MNAVDASTELPRTEIPVGMLRHETGTAKVPIEIKKVILPERVGVFIREAPEGNKGALVQIITAMQRGLSKAEADHAANRGKAMGQGPTESMELESGEFIAIRPFRKGEVFRISAEDDWVLLEKYEDPRFTRAVPPLVAIKIEDPDLARQIVQLTANDYSIVGMRLTPNLENFIYSAAIPEIKPPPGKESEPLVAHYEETVIRLKPAPQKIETAPVPVITTVSKPTEKPKLVEPVVEEPIIEESLEEIKPVNIEVNSITTFTGSAIREKFTTNIGGVTQEVVPVVGICREKGQESPSIAFGFEVTGGKSVIISSKDFLRIIKVVRAMSLLTEIAKSSGTFDHSWLNAALVLMDDKYVPIGHQRFKTELVDDIAKINAKRKTAGQPEIVLDELTQRARKLIPPRAQLDSVIRTALDSDTQFDIEELSGIPEARRSSLVSQLIAKNEAAQTTPQKKPGVGRRLGVLRF